ncbi:MAG: hypothetical protein AAGJ82_10065 [Bacteroidota bacterium]
MKRFLILLFLLPTGWVLSQDRPSIPPQQPIKYVLADAAALRLVPDEDSEVLKYLTWAQTVTAVATEGSWSKVFAEDGAKLYYLLSEMLGDTLTFVERARALTDKSPRVYYELLRVYDQPQYQEQQEALASEWLQARREGHVELGPTVCTDVNYVAYRYLAKRYLATERINRLRVLRAISKPTATWVRLDLAKAAIDQGDFRTAQRYLTEVFQS